MTETDLRHDLRTHVTRLGGARAVTDDADLFGSGAIKSMQLMELINWLEDTYGVRIEQRDVMTGKLRSVTSITRLVLDRRQAA